MSIWSTIKAFFGVQPTQPVPHVEVPVVVRDEPKPFPVPIMEVHLEPPSTPKAPFVSAHKAPAANREQPKKVVASEQKRIDTDGDHSQINLNAAQSLSLMSTSSSKQAAARSSESQYTPPARSCPPSSASDSYLVESGSSSCSSSCD